MTKKQAMAGIQSHSQAEAIMYLDNLDNFLGVLQALEDSGRVEINCP